MAKDYVNWGDQRLTTEPVVVPISSSNGAYSAARLNRVEKRVEGMEHYVHGRGWITRLVAWVGLAIAISIGFAVQQHRIDQLHRTPVPASQEKNQP